MGRVDTRRHTFPPRPAPRSRFASLWCPRLSSRDTTQCTSVSRFPLPGIVAMLAVAALSVGCGAAQHSASASTSTSIPATTPTTATVTTTTATITTVTTTAPAQTTAPPTVTWPTSSSQAANDGWLCQSYPATTQPNGGNLFDEQGTFQVSTFRNAICMTQYAGGPPYVGSDYPPPPSGIYPNPSPGTAAQTDAFTDPLTWPNVPPAGTYYVFPPGASVPRR
jgi:large repetitive protein